MANPIGVRSMTPAHLDRYSPGRGTKKRNPHKNLIQKNDGLLGR
ncbi:MAG: hypothetical protein P8I54_02690 [Flavobacteriaceae bacterium]|nr:hypothetical protein [Flavobacteriaceae bacterium]